MPSRVKLKRRCLRVVSRPGIKRRCPLSRPSIKMTALRLSHRQQFFPPHPPDHLASPDTTTRRAADPCPPTPPGRCIGGTPVRFHRVMPSAGVVDVAFAAAAGDDFNWPPLPPAHDPHFERDNMLTSILGQNGVDAVRPLLHRGVTLMQVFQVRNQHRNFEATRTLPRVAR